MTGDQRCRLTDAPGRAPTWREKIVPHFGVTVPWFYRSHRVWMLFWLGRVFVLWKQKLK